MTWRTDNDFTDETICILEISQHFLVVYFGHEQTETDKMLSDYFKKFQLPDPESTIAHVLSWGMAKRIHFTMSLGGNIGEQAIWEVENKLRGTPPEALAYMREKYWKNYPMFEEQE